MFQFELNFSAILSFQCWYLISHCSLRVVISKVQNLQSNISIQWQIQDFPDGEGVTPEKTYHLERFLPKTAWKLKKLDQEGVRIPGAPLGSANATVDPQLYLVGRRLSGCFWLLTSKFKPPKSSIAGS